MRGGLPWLLLALHVASRVQRSWATLRVRKVPEVLAATAVDGQQLQLTRTNGDAWYTVPLGLGGNVSHVVVDTASPWLWSYNGNADSTEQQSEAERFSISYLSAELAGIVITEGVALHADSEAGKGRCKAGMATNGDAFWVKQYKSGGVQGVLGLACGTGDSGAGAEAAKGLQTGLECMSIAMDGDSSGWAGGSSMFALQLTDTGGTLTFGPPPMELLRGLVPMPAAMHCGNWRAPVRVSAGSKDFGFSDATLDSAAPGIIGQSEHVASLARELGARIDVREGRMVFVMPCSRGGSLPQVELHLGRPGHEAHVQLSAEELLVPDDSTGSTPDDQRNGRSGAKQCRLIFSGWDSPQWLLGTPFFRSVRGVLFNTDTQAVSIAP